MAIRFHQYCQKYVDLNFVHADSVDEDRHTGVGNYINNLKKLTVRRKEVRIA